MESKHNGKDYVFEMTASDIQKVFTEWGRAIFNQNAFIPGRSGKTLEKNAELDAKEFIHFLKKI